MNSGNANECFFISTKQSGIKHHILQRTNITSFQLYILYDGINKDVFYMETF